MNNTKKSVAKTTLRLKLRPATVARLQAAAKERGVGVAELLAAWVKEELREEQSASCRP